MTIRITTLIENEKPPLSTLTAEHGLSFFIEHNGHRLIFDTGQSGAFLANARRLHVDPAAVSQVVVSHGHYDHSGGVSALLEEGLRFELTVHPRFFEPKYSLQDGAYLFKGNAFTPADLERNGGRVNYLTAGHVEIFPGVHVIGDFPRRSPLEGRNPRFHLRAGTDYRPDDFADEILVTLETPRGLVVLLGCGHPGVVNMLERVRAVLAQPFYAVLGGTHLTGAAPARIQATLDYLRAAEVPHIGLSHCTGAAAIDLFAREPGGCFFENRTGAVFEII